MVDEWQPIETAPKDGTHILLYVPADSADHAPEAMVTGFWYALYSEWDLVMAWGYEAESQVYGEPSHWTPLPPPPRTSVTIDAALKE